MKTFWYSIVLFILSAKVFGVKNYDGMAQQVKNAENRWRCHNTLIESLSYLLDTNLLTDVTFVVGPSKSRIQAHKLILAARSPVFYAMLEGPLAETGDINIPDIDSTTFTAMLRYLYTDEVAVTESNIESMLYVAEKYDISLIKIQCDELMAKNVSTNPIASLQIAEQYGLQEVRTKCLKVINTIPLKFLGDKSRDYLKLRREVLHTIFQSDNLNLKEIQVYKAAVRWAEAECTRQNLEICDESIRRVLGPTIKTIRFPIMPVQTFCNEVSKNSLLTFEEKTNIFQCIVTEDKEFVSLFKSTRRTSVNNIAVNRFESLGKEQSWWKCESKIDAIDFTVVNTTYITGISLYGGKNDGDHFTYDVSLKNEMQYTLSEVKGEVTTTTEDETYTVMLPQPVTLIQDTMYTVSVLLKGPQTWYGIDGKATVDIGKDNKIAFTRSSTSLNGTNVSTGQIPGILLSEE